MGVLVFMMTRSNLHITLFCWWSLYSVCLTLVYHVLCLVPTSLDSRQLSLDVSTLEHRSGSSSMRRGRGSKRWKSISGWFIIRQNSGFFWTFSVRMIRSTCRKHCKQVMSDVIYPSTVDRFGFGKEHLHKIISSRNKQVSSKENMRLCLV